VISKPWLLSSEANRKVFARSELYRLDQKPCGAKNDYCNSLFARAFCDVWRRVAKRRDESCWRSGRILMRRLIIACIVVVAVVTVTSIPTTADARRGGGGWRAGGWPGPGVGLPPWGWRGLGWDSDYVYSPIYYGYGCHRPVLFWTPPPYGLAWQYHRVC
jgi:hypothetical protein